MLGIKFIDRNLILTIIALIPVFDMIYGIINAKKIMLTLREEVKNEHREEYEEYIRNFIHLISTISFIIIDNTVLRLLIAIVYLLIGFIYAVVYFKISEKKNEKILFVILATIYLGIFLVAIV
ncbi:hypothetical protein [Caloranaerobacter sp. DY30410]|uniref:hypothetical protein n=1 Tax=Caloranaerobacter sp. DY30410 TaxID=3238305 RepID=UPI003CFD33FF